MYTAVGFLHFTCRVVSNSLTEIHFLVPLLIANSKEAMDLPKKVATHIFMHVYASLYEENKGETIINRYIHMFLFLNTSVDVFFVSSSAIFFFVIPIWNLSFNIGKYRCIVVTADTTVRIFDSTKKRLKKNLYMYLFLTLLLAIFETFWPDTRKMRTTVFFLLR